MWKQIYDHFKDLNPYPPGAHNGECLSRYFVIREGTQSPFIGRGNLLGYRGIDLILFVPANDYTELEDYADEIRERAKGLKWLRKTGVETPALPDDSNKSITMSIEYQLIKRLEG